jgi:uncharacterized damage-inducible protein DinB
LKNKLKNACSYCRHFLLNNNLFVLAIPLFEHHRIMKEYFIRLFDYDQYANRLLLQSILAAHEPEQPVILMAHLLAVQQIWLKRCQHAPAPGGATWPDWKADTFEHIINDNHRQLIDFLTGLQSADFDSSITYQNSRGEEFSSRLVDILGHIINHGTHHRAQVGQQLKFTGVEKLPVTDYILYLRQL